MSSIAAKYLGKPCKKCGDREKYTNGRTCVACAKARTATWQLVNKERYAQIKAASVARNSHTHRAQQSRRRAAISKAGGSYTATEIAELYIRQSGRCTYCKGDFTEIECHHDHKVPVSRGGSSNIFNIQLLCQTCNLRKGTMTHEEYSAKLENEL